MNNFSNGSFTRKKKENKKGIKKRKKKKNDIICGQYKYLQIVQIMMGKKRLDHKFDQKL
jgi:hypothetical protein